MQESEIVQRVPRNLNLMTTQESPKLLLVRVLFPGGLLPPTFRIGEAVCSVGRLWDPREFYETEQVWILLPVLDIQVVRQILSRTVRCARAARTIR